MSAWLRTTTQDARSTRSVKDKIEELKQQIIDGELKVG